ncbi:MAG: alpha/beta fold hydrolase [Chloroflexota bacterium]
METGLDGSIHAHGLIFHYLEWGSPDSPPLVLLHGFGNQAHLWDGFAPTAAARHHVYAFDLRGHGDTEHAETYGNRLNAQDLEALVDALSLAPFGLVGFSMGGIASMLYASDHPNAVSRLVLVDVGPEMDPRGLARLKATIGQARSTFATRDETLAYIRLANPRMSEGLVVQALGYAFRPRSDGSYEMKYDERLRASFGRGGTGSASLWERLTRIGCPTLIVRGEDSDLFMHDTALRMLDVLPDARLETVAGAGHAAMLDNPEGFNAAVGAFL